MCWISCRWWRIRWQFVSYTRRPMVFCSAVQSWYANFLGDIAIFGHNAYKMSRKMRPSAYRSAVECDSEVPAFLVSTHHSVVLEPLQWTADHADVHSTDLNRRRSKISCIHCQRCELMAKYCHSHHNFPSFHFDWPIARVRPVNHTKIVGHHHHHHHPLPCKCVHKKGKSKMERCLFVIRDTFEIVNAATYWFGKPLEFEFEFIPFRCDDPFEWFNPIREFEPFVEPFVTTKPFKWPTEKRTGKKCY